MVPARSPPPRVPCGPALPPLAGAPTPRPQPTEAVGLIEIPQICNCRLILQEVFAALIPFFICVLLIFEFFFFFFNCCCSPCCRLRCCGTKERQPDHPRSQLGACRPSPPASSRQWQQAGATQGLLQPGAGWSLGDQGGWWACLGVPPPAAVAASLPLHSRAVTGTHASVSGTRAHEHM